MNKGIFLLYVYLGCGVVCATVIAIGARIENLSESKVYALPADIFLNSFQVSSVLLMNQTNCDFGLIMRAIKPDFIDLNSPEG
ncbi:hypothetical protein BCM14_0298 [Jezberella montanilacus]|uniref:Uncharacterized protein n=1 Tax=Jezberella montanilacus TaxID=323426 RepID=A0A2T0XNI7_9BURK|nr:hypothetical protein BCM14_0298 [Jezberella montanilacus]